MTRAECWEVFVEKCPEEAKAVDVWINTGMTAAQIIRACDFGAEIDDPVTVRLLEIAIEHRYANTQRN